MSISMGMKDVLDFAASVKYEIHKEIHNTSFNEGNVNDMLTLRIIELLNKYKALTNEGKTVVRDSVREIVLLKCILDKGKHSRKSTHSDKV